MQQEVKHAHALVHTGSNLLDCDDSQSGLIDVRKCEHGVAKRRQRRVFHQYWNVMSAILVGLPAVYNFAFLKGRALSRLVPIVCIYPNPDGMRKNVKHHGITQLPQRHLAREQGGLYGETLRHGSLGRERCAELRRRRRWKLPSQHGANGGYVGRSSDKDDLVYRRHLFVRFERREGLVHDKLSPFHKRLDSVIKLLSRDGYDHACVRYCRLIQSWRVIIHIAVVILVFATTKSFLSFSALSNQVRVLGCFPGRRRGYLTVDVTSQVLIDIVPSQISIAFS
mmetsp:Transcript_7947/g.18138  ORF Transcript_7947/g.18138 Transcript_7947/m.18138 type:complete len:281 (-) Transcript_7947:238-1080(-)